MKKIKDKKIIVLGAILLLFTVFYFVIANKVSYAFENNIDFEKILNSRVETITKCAVKYGENNEAEFNEEGVIYITVQNLIDKNLLATDEDGIIKNPMDSNENLNNKKIRIKKENDKITAEIYS